MVKRKPPPKKKRKIEREGYHLPTRSEAEQFADLSPDLFDAWKRLKKFALALGPQGEMRTSHRSIMFYGKTCYFFVRPKKAFLELNVFLGRSLQHASIRKVTAVSKTKWVHVIAVVHEDQVEEPLTDWIREAFEFARKSV